MSVVNLEPKQGTVTPRVISDDDADGKTQVVPISRYGKIYITDPILLLDPGDTVVQGYLEISRASLGSPGSVVFGNPTRSSFFFVWDLNGIAAPPWEKQTPR